METTLKNLIASAIVKARKERSLTQIKLANILGVSIRTVRDWEKGLHEPKSSGKNQLRTKLKIDFPALLKESRKVDK